MIKVGLITTWAPERCGVRTYGEELVRRADPDIEYTVISRPFDRSVISRTAHCDVVHILHVNALYPEITVEVINELKAAGKKTVCTFNDSTSENRSVFTVAFDKTVVHQPTSDGFEYIYHGIPTKELKPFDNSLTEFVGTSGFPMGFKNYPLAAKLAQAVGMKLYAILPESQHADVKTVIRDIQRECPGSIIDTGFPSHDEVLDKLSQCAFLLYPYSHTGTGIGGSARMGMAAGRPVVISNVVRFADILAEEKYAKEFYIIQDPYPTFDTAIHTVRQVVQDMQNGTARVPKKTVEDMSWEVVSKKYYQLYRGLMV